MPARSLNKVQLIGNLTRDPELRYTPQGTAVCTFGLATNRSWTTEAGEKKEDTEFHRIVAWNKLAELCSQLLFKGRKVYVEGRLQTRQWSAQDGSSRQTTEVVISDMMILDSRRAPGEGGVTESIPVEGETEMTSVPEDLPPAEEAEEVTVKKAASVSKPAASPKAIGKSSVVKAKAEEKKTEGKKVQPVEESDEVKPEDIPF
ncbi:single-stranded DNA-binding protein [Candidatus Shapirobacteria bacterium]|nr:single-stranded DNA-binding protein [Candidatus Shapirobacteria bacterium]